MNSSHCGCYFHQPLPRLHHHLHCPPPPTISTSTSTTRTFYYRIDSSSRVPYVWSPQVEDLSHLGTWDLGPGGNTCLTNKYPEGQKAEQLPRILALEPWPEKIRGAPHSPPGEEDQCQSGLRGASLGSSGDKTGWLVSTSHSGLGVDGGGAPLWAGRANGAGGVNAHSTCIAVAPLLLEPVVA